ncbi:MAG: adenylate kinase [Candidatus Aenigmarchaeota archaeon]|nr:adenylate kinase [Candidatus Aenigmarchaeota archaeon]
MKIIITAVPGCGKTTVLNFLKKHAEEDKKNVVFANFGDYMFEEAKKRGLAEHRDGMRPLPKNVQEELQLAAAKKISEITGSVIIDTHASIKTRFGYWSGLPESILKILKPDVIISLEKDPQIILEKRAGDKEREKIGARDKETAEEIDLHQKINRAFVIAYAALVGAAVKIVEAKGEETEPLGHAKQAARKIWDDLKDSI